MSLTTGQVVYNRYRIARLLGQGGMGAVYRAWDTRLNVHMALKEMIPQPGLDPHTLAQLRQQFEQEAMVLAKLDHPHLVGVSDFFEEEGNTYLVMKFIEGENLADRVEREGTLPEAQVLAWAGQLLDALATCHAQHIIHRDVKPQNIIIRPDGRAVLVDFGLVKLWDPRHPQTQRVIRGMGTREYASPEHYGLGGRHTEPRSDLYSLGATMYHALTGQEPPSAMDRWATPSSFITPRRLRADLQPETESAILRAMTLDLNQRVQDTREMTSALGVEGDARVESIAAPFQVNVSSKRRPSVSAVIPRDTRWPLEMATAMVMAVVGVLAMQSVLFASYLSFERYLGLSVGALLVGAAGWFAGDLIFQALAQSESTDVAPAAGRPTQRLVAFTRRLTRQLSTAQQVALLAALLVGAAASAWLLGPLVFDIPLLWNNLPSYAVAGPLVYAATGRRRWRTLIAHTLVATTGGAVLWTRVGISYDVGTLFLAAVGGGLLMEGIAFLAERRLFCE